MSVDRRLSWWLRRVIVAAAVVFCFVVLPLDIDFANGIGQSPDAESEDGVDANSAGIAPRGAGAGAASVHADGAKASAGVVAAVHDYVELFDQSGRLSMVVPVEWSDVSSGPWDFGGELVGYSLFAAPDRQGWYDGWDTPGVFFAASALLRQRYTTLELLDHPSNEFGGVCEYGGRFEYDDGVYHGQFDVWTDCGGTDAVLSVITAEPDDESFLVMLQIIVITVADLGAEQVIIDSFLADLSDLDAYRLFAPGLTHD